MTTPANRSITSLPYPCAFLLLETACSREARGVIAAGVGSQLWRVRVDLFAEDESAHRVQAAWDALRSLLTTDGRGDGPGDLGADQGTGATMQPVVGLTFWVRADDVGAAASTAVETARSAGASCGVGPDLYDVTVIPSNAVAEPGDSQYPVMPD
jgi:hypothetical protein